MTLRARQAASLAAGWAVALFGLSVGLPSLGLVQEAPQRADVQKAYDAAKASAGSRHQDDLVIRDADCAAIPHSRFACQIDFVLQRQPTGRLYFTVVTLEGAPDRWTLIGGLCRGP